MSDMDQAKFLRFLSTAGKVTIFMACSDTPAALQVGTPEQLADAIVVGRDLYYLWNEETSTPPILIEVPAQNLWCVDHQQSETVEFDPSERLDRTIKAGRLHTDRTRLQAGQVVSKGESFLSWYEALARWIRTEYRHDEHLQAYVAPGAWSLVRQGWQLR
jgi:hypothetical protein